MVTGLANTLAASVDSVRSKGSHTFSIPRTSEGDEFRNMLRRYTNSRVWQFRTRLRDTWSAVFFKVKPIDCPECAKLEAFNIPDSQQADLFARQARKFLNSELWDIVQMDTRVFLVPKCKLHITS
jgi:hypothetical protein